MRLLSRNILEKLMVRQKEYYELLMFGLVFYIPLSKVQYGKVRPGNCFSDPGD